MYEALKHTHMLCAFLSISGFILRSIWAFQGSNLLNHKVSKVLPHINDTILLICAIAMAITIEQYPFVSSWLTAKVLGLIAYIILATYTLKRARNNQHRAVFFVLSIVSFGYIASVARTHNAFFFMT